MMGLTRHHFFWLSLFGITLMLSSFSFQLYKAFDARWIIRFPKKYELPTEKWISVFLDNTSFSVALQNWFLKAFYHYKDYATKYEGQISTWKRDNNNYPCFRCLFPNKPKNSQVTNCSSNGVIGSLGGFMGSLQATEIIKEILEIKLNHFVYLLPLFQKLV